MTDSLGLRTKFAVLTRSTGTSVQPEFDSMRPLEVTNGINRVAIPNIPLIRHQVRIGGFGRLLERH